VFYKGSQVPEGDIAANHSAAARVVGTATPAAVLSQTPSSTPSKATFSQGSEYIPSQSEDGETQHSL